MKAARTQGPLTSNIHLIRWVEKTAQLTKPDHIHWVDGSQEEYDKLLKGGIGYSQQITTPAHAKSLRIAVHDLVSGRLGVVEVPLAAVSKLDPPS